MDHPFLDPILKWWTKPSNIPQARLIQAPPPQLAAYTDASTSGLGAQCSDQSAAGLWSAIETTRHVNELEAVSHSEGCPRLRPPDQGEGGDDPLAQQLNSCLPAESGGHTLSAHVSSNMANLSGVPAAGYQPVSEAHPRSAQCSSR